MSKTQLHTYLQSGRDSISSLAITSWLFSSLFCAHLCHFFFCLLTGLGAYVTCVCSFSNTKWSESDLFVCHGIGSQRGLLYICKSLNNSALLPRSEQYVLHPKEFPCTLLLTMHRHGTLQSSRTCYPLLFLWWNYYEMLLMEIRRFCWRDINVVFCNCSEH